MGGESESLSFENLGGQQQRHGGISAISCAKALGWDGLTESFH